MTFRQLQPGTFFTLLHGAGDVLVKLDDRRAIALHTGAIEPVHFHKKTEPPAPIGYSKSLFLAEYRGKPVIARKMSATCFEVAYYVISKVEFCRNPLELTGIPYEKNDEASELLHLIHTDAQEVVSMSESLITLRKKPSL